MIAADVRSMSVKQLQREIKRIASRNVRSERVVAYGDTEGKKLSSRSALPVARPMTQSAALKPSIRAERISSFQLSLPTEIATQSLQSALKSSAG